MKVLFFSFALFTVALSANCQGFHINLFAGTSNYRGDLQSKRFTFNQAHLAGGLGFSYDLSQRLAVRAGFKIGKISGDDKYGRNSARNLSFSSQLTEGDIDFQYFITPLGARSLTPYFFAGLALYHYDPYTFDSTGTKYYLPPLSTEGEGFVAGRKMYSLTQVGIPFGAGVKLALSDNLNVGVELGFRKLFTDYLDDVSTTYVDKNLLLANRGQKAVELSYRGDEIKGGSLVYPNAGAQRGNPGSKDWYYFTGVTLSFRIGNGLLGHGNGKNSDWDCPKSVL